MASVAGHNTICNTKQCRIRVNDEDFTCSCNTFHKVFGLYAISFMGSIIACYISQTVDISLYLWIRKITKGRYLWIRNNGSTAISLLIDTSTVITFMTIFGVLPKEQMVSLIINSYSFKLFFTICSIPLFYLCISIIKILTSQKKVE